MGREALRQAILANPMEPLASVEIEPWGTIYIRPITIGDIDSGAGAEAASVDKMNLARFCCRIMSDETGSRIFDPSVEDDVKLVADLSFERMQKVLDKSKKMSGQGQGVEEELKKGSIPAVDSPST